MKEVIEYLNNLRIKLAFYAAEDFFSLGHDSIQQFPAWDDIFNKANRLADSDSPDIHIAFFKSWEELRVQTWQGSAASISCAARVIDHWHISVSF